jgi:hypothetical protein
VTRKSEQRREDLSDELEQATLSLVRTMRADGVSFRGIRRETIERGMLSRKGRPFSIQAVFAMATA